MLTVATFNVRHGLPTGRRRVDPAGTAAAVASLGADVVGLQEVDVGVPRSGGVDLAAVVADASPGRSVHFARATGVDGGSYGNALVVRGSITRARDHRLGGRGEPRVCTVASVEVDGLGTVVGLTHLSPPRHGTAQPLAQLAEVLDLLDAAERPQVLLGDLNLGPSEVLGPLSARGWAVPDTPPTFPARFPRARIDWVAVRGWTLVGATVPSVRASDHRPVVATLSRPFDGASGTPYPREAEEPRRDG